MFPDRAFVIALSIAQAWASACREPLQWPYLPESVWNTPIGSDAQFSPARLYTSVGPNAVQPDDVFVVQTHVSDPLVPWFDQGHWGRPYTPAAYCNVTGKLVQNISFPDSLNFTNFGGNNCGAILQPDGRTVWFMHPLYVCSPGGAVLALYGVGANGATSADIISSLGNLGGLGGSGLSGFGSSIRLGQLVPGAPPISHALSLQLFAHEYYYRPPDGNQSRLFRWPAVQADSGALNFYNGTDPYLTPGSLLAIPLSSLPSLNASLTTQPARQILWALAHYGAYIVADAAWPAASFTTEGGVQAEFAAAWGFPFLARPGTGPAGDWYNDLVKILRALAIVINNADNAVGGGGIPCQPPPPPFCGEYAQASTPQA